MRLRLRAVVTAAALVAAGLALHANSSARSEAEDIQLQLANLLLRDGWFPDALEAYQRAMESDDPALVRVARAGLVESALHVARFDLAREEAETLLRDEPSNPSALSLYGDALWANGLFDEAEAAYRQALAREPRLARGLHGLAKSFLARSRYSEAMTRAQAALAIAPRDLEIHHTVGVIFERQHQYPEAAAAYTNFANLLPSKEPSDREVWSRAQIRFLKAFGDRVPLQMDAESDGRLHTVDFRLVRDKVVVKASVNGAPSQDFIVDTGAEDTVISQTTARRLDVVPITNTLSAGVGDSGLRALALTRLESLQIGDLKIRNVPCIIKDPPLRDLPSREMESFSPLALGLSVTIDYGARTLVMGHRLPDDPGQVELPLRMYRLATVLGTIDGIHNADFVIDTGGEVISISQAMAGALAIDMSRSRLVPLRVYGNSGRERSAFLLVPGIDLAFGAISYRKIPVVVLNLTAPSALLGYKLGGILGYKFLSNYRVTIDLDRSVLRLTRLTS